MTTPETSLADDIAAVCNASYDVWQRACREDADRDVAAYLVRAFEQHQRAVKAAAKAALKVAE